MGVVIVDHFDAGAPDAAVAATIARSSTSKKGGAPQQATIIP